MSHQPPWDYIAKLVCIGDSGTGKSSLTIRLCEGRFTTTHDVTIGVEFGSRIVPVGPPASDELDDDEASQSQFQPSHIPTTSFPETQTPSASKHSSRPSSSPSNANPDPSPQHLSSGLPPPPQKPKSQAAPPVQKRMKLSLWDTAGQETYKSITRSYFRGASGALLVFDITRPPTFSSLSAWLQDLQQIAEEGIVVVLVGNKSDLVKDADRERGEGYITRAQAEAWCRANGVVRYVETSAKSGENVERAFLEVAERIYRNIEAGRYDLNDRRSGVKGYGSTSGSRTGGGKLQRTVTLGVNDAMGRGGTGWAGGCC
ncbi:small GTP-binding protein [Coccidioides immitis RS]|uniref:Small GTP-binding protein n=2 Tax=Coccidioides immitis TaxID=5501 RepID=J3KLL5_COCIM|nr:small GTP-binding protein [Coccidioides immitis RS]EAS37195.3 small GTP-binding protein [Coccidioides immitis RS]KMP10143.1 GTP-binding protein ypt4 [Coccidioides immitis RMSCC 2394]